MRATEFINKQQGVAEVLSWSALDEGLSLEDKMTIFEEYAIRGNLTESIDQDKKDYFISLFELSTTPVKNKKYIVAPLALVGNRIMPLDNPRIMSFLAQDTNGLVFDTADGKKTYPSKTLRDLSVFNIFTFASRSAYDKFRTALALKFGIVLPSIGQAECVAEAAGPSLEEIIQAFVKSPVGQQYKKHDCKTVTRAFVQWAEQNNIPTEVITFAPPSAEFISKNPKFKGKSGEGDGHIMPIVNGNAIDFTVRQFGVGRTFENPLVTPVGNLKSVYGKFGYYTDAPEWFLGGKSFWQGPLGSIPNEIFNQNFGDELLEQGVAEGTVDEGSIPVYKSPSQFYAGGKTIYKLFRNAFPNLPEHVANDIYNQTSPGTNDTIVNALKQGHDPKSVFLNYYSGITFNFSKDPGTSLTPQQMKTVLLNGRWSQKILTVNPADFAEHSRNRMVKRNFGINPDEDPTRIQRQQSRAKGDGSNEPVIIIQTSNGLILWEGFHRTMSILALGKNGEDPLRWNKVKLRAWVVEIPNQQGVAEAWSEKYKRSINCDNPKGFSQRAHCQGRKKNNEEIELEERKRKRKKKTARYYYGPAYYFGATDTGAEGGDGGGLEEDWKKSLANIGLAGAIGLGAAGGLEIKDKIKSAFTKPTTQTTQQIQSTKKAQSSQVQVSPITSSPLETYLMDTAKRAGLTGIELAQFLGQCAHETLDYKRMIERGAKKYFNKYEPKFAPKKAKILGNVKPGDGERYKGRGYIQLTGRYNYKMAGQALNLPLEQNPELAAQPEIAAKIALWYWSQRVRPEVENFADTTSVTRKINPGLSGLEDRHQNFVSYIAQRDD